MSHSPTQPESPRPNQDIPQYTDFQRYLSAKRTVDDRALNAHVWEGFIDALGETAHLPGSSKLPGRSNLPKLLEIGAGIGTMVERLLETKRLNRIDYTAIDANEENIRTAAGRLQQWGQRAGRRIEQEQGVRDEDLQDAHTRDVDLRCTSDEAAWSIHLRCLDLFALLRQAQAYGPYDALIAHAFLDLVDSAQVLPRLGALLRPGAYLLLTINFDGVTIFQPAIDPVYDQLIESLYHATMDNRVVDGQPSGDSQTGRHLYHQLRDASYTVLAAGSSDWVVAPFNRAYIADEAYFLHFIVDTVYSALAGHPELKAERFRRWIQTRHAQIEANELLYIAHQMDYLVRHPGRG